MLKIKVEIEVDEKEWRYAIAAGWLEIYGETIEGKEIKVLDNPDDFQRAFPYIDSKCIEKVEVVDV